MNKNTKILSILLIIIIIAVIGYTAFINQKRYFPEFKTYANDRVGYSLTVPAKWTAVIDKAYKESVDSMIEKFSNNSKSNREEVSMAIFASNSGLADCADEGPDFNNCITKVPSGVYVSVSVSYPGDQAEIDGAIEYAAQVFGTKYVAPSIMIAGKKAFVESTGLERCQNCLYHRQYSFVVNKYKYEIEEISYIKPEDNQSDTVSQYQQQLEDVIKNISLKS